MVKVWYYKQSELYHSFTKPHELRCMDYLHDEGTLLIGTNSGFILSHKIEQYLNFNDFDEMQMLEMGDMEDYDELTLEDEFDPLGGKTVDQNIEEILAKETAFTKGKATFKR